MIQRIIGAFVDRNYGTIVINFIVRTPVWLQILVAVSVLAGGTVWYQQYQQAHHGEVRLTGGARWSDPGPVTPGQSLDLAFDTTKSRRYLALTLSLVSTRSDDAVCQLHATAAVALTSGAEPSTSLHHNESAYLRLPGGTPGPFRVTLSGDTGCEMKMAVVDAVLTDEPVATH
ncbi:hypothetical protein J2S46_008088 [Kitasatospora herbaricolor]|uniref:hypothetical protein n=1 Tax=Kitasatospora herbaricolor TaxID=68217 RepID=UPI0027944787|nr:hypothetical protein [Kitasatospora herbaricolor]MDQ0313435.1 hypothetical protein [Kitasatospora herbaricolor]